ncbi:MAG: RluA family pseudouridine synthase [Deltaproteobacteria bacterium]|nr:RluA family pseudouridine synthase [Deltaproteobacteria bacterium]
MRDLDVIFEDNHLLCINKPAGLPTQPDVKGGASALESARTYLKLKYNKPGNVYLGMVHRLDKPVSGVLLFAKTSKAAKRLSAQFRERHVKKHYLAVVEGRIRQQANVIESFVWRDEGACVTLVSDVPTKNAKPAKLEFFVLAVRKDYSLVEIHMLTGRKHQIRAQLSFIGHPIVGDNRYGGKARLKSGSIALQSSSLEIEHPTKHSIMTFSIEPPGTYPWDLFTGLL